MFFWCLNLMLRYAERIYASIKGTSSGLRCLFNWAHVRLIICQLWINGHFNMICKGYVYIIGRGKGTVSPGRFNRRSGQLHSNKPEGPQSPLLPPKIRRVPSPRFLLVALVTSGHLIGLLLDFCFPNYCVECRILLLELQPHRQHPSPWA